MSLKNVIALLVLFSSFNILANRQLDLFSHTPNSVGIMTELAKRVDEYFSVKKVQEEGFDVLTLSMDSLPKKFSEQVTMLRRRRIRALTSHGVDNGANITCYMYAVLDKKSGTIVGYIVDIWDNNRWGDGVSGVINYLAANLHVVASIPRLSPF